MQTALNVYFQTIDALLLDNEIDKAYEALIELDNQTQADIKNDVLLITSSYRQSAKMFQQGLIDFNQFNMQTNKAKFGLQEMMKSVPRKIELNAKIKGLGSYQFSVPDDAKLEKIIGQNNLLRIKWLEEALKASKAVCRVVCADGELGTGFLTKEGYVFTNNHVIKSADVAKTARLEFNYEIGTDGKTKARTTYQLDASDFKSSPPNEFDFARVKVIDRADAPLKQWGFVEFDPDAIPAVGEGVTIIQHPKGEDKQIALNANEVLGQLNQHLFYSTDTEPGSSGSPVFNKDWKVVAIHHAGKTDAEGGLVINERGERRGANRGILFRNIFAFIGQ
ncbi:MAG: trypsin-like peptidase domain-containing protein [Saprospiraceae bacterium]|nr:trypsin-like peptidase domain-containing protein [Saprospiraceae bacterium]